jgi:1-acyl-sn-glycerol-3-phosphate acyltransferase
LYRGYLALPLIALYTVAFGVPATLCGMVGLPRAVHGLAKAWARTVLWTLGIEISVSGAEHCPSGPAVYAANHTSVVDTALVFGYLPVDFKILHKRSLYLVPVVGQYLYAGGHIGIHRGSGFRARKGLERAAARIRGGTSVVVFPEGTRQRGEGVGAFKRGSFVLALEAGVPVVPLSIIGVKGVSFGALRVRAGKVRVVVHPPVPTAGRDSRQAAALAEEVRRIVTLGCEAA